MTAIPVDMATLITNVKFLVFVYHSFRWPLLGAIELQRFQLFLRDQIEIGPIAFHAAAKDVIFDIDNVKKVEDFFELVFWTISF